LALRLHDSVVPPPPRNAKLVMIRHASRAVVAASAVLILAGCLEPISSPEFSPVELDEQVLGDPKLVNGHLLSQTSLTTAAGKDDKDEIRIIIRWFDSRQPKAEKFLKENGFLTRHGFLTRQSLSGSVLELASAVQFDKKKIQKTFGLEKDDDIIMPALSYLLQQGEIAEIEPDLRVQSENIGLRPYVSDDDDDDDGTSGGGNQTVPWSVPHIGAPLPDVTPAQLAGVSLYILDTAANEDDLNLVETLEMVRRSGKDTFTHGYHIAGTAGAIDNDTGVLGVAPGLSIHNVVVLNQLGMTSSSIVISALESVVAAKRADPSRPVIASLSFGAYIGVTWQTALDQAVTDAVNSGVIVVISAGNLGMDADRSTPAHALGAITVGSHDAKNKHSKFSNYGSVVDILGPGEEILSLGRISKKKIELLLGSGTSFAVPHVAGALASVLARDPSLSASSALSAISSDGCVSRVPSNTTTACVQLR
jgi:subtilisin family serine protease